VLYATSHFAGLVAVEHDLSPNAAIHKIWFREFRAIPFHPNQARQPEGSISHGRERARKTVTLWQMTKLLRHR
jgi:hypothetical protein